MSENENAPRPDLPVCSITGEQTPGRVYILNTTDGETVYVSHDAMFPKGRTSARKSPAVDTTKDDAKDDAKGDMSGVKKDAGQ